MISVLDRQTLVLNRLWQPVNTCSARRAVTLIFLGHAQVVSADEQNNFYTYDLEAWVDCSRRGPNDEVIRAVSACFRVPEIIVLSMFDRLPKKQVKLNRENIYRRDGYRCQYCGEQFDARDLNLDHVTPREKGGKTTWENLVCSCIPCNTRKANKLPSEAKMFPRRQPKPPSWRPLFSTTPRPFRYKSWSHFLEPGQGKVELSM